MGRPFEPVAAVPLAEQNGQSFTRLVELMRRLLADDGCPWDREQTLPSLRKYVLEEACEVIDAIDSGDRKELCTELGDLALQIVFQAELAKREGAFGIDDVSKAICDKLVHRHPHVFADAVVESSSDVLTNWERIKAEEKANEAKSANGKKKGVLDGVPRSLPGLTRAQRVGEKVARVGFDWPDARGSRDKVTEEIGELDRAIAEAAGDANAADGKAKVEEELGDALFALVNLARHLDIDAEGALRRTTDKFTKRFSHVEARVNEVYGSWPKSVENRENLTLEELDRFWDEAKAREAAAKTRA